MSKYIALFRAVNVGGTGKVSMAELRTLLARLGFENATTLLQSGNVVFEGAKRASSQLETLLEKETESAFKVRADCIVRTATEWQRMVDTNPFPRQAKADPARLVVVPFKTKPAGDIEALRSAIRGREAVALAGRELYAYYPDGQGQSKLTIGLIERHLGARGTVRNWNTVLKIAEVCGAE